jgi:bifunctional DNA primase/polymerase-like protein/primase-like protein
MNHKHTGLHRGDGDEGPGFQDAVGMASYPKRYAPTSQNCQPRAAKLEPDREQNLLNAALAYAAAGLVIVPTGHDKVALVKWAKIDRPPTEAEVRRLWRKWPDAWIGLLTGHRSGLDVVDLDDKAGKNGFDAVPDRAELTPVTAQTPSGSVHLYFKASETRTTGSFIAPGVDTRGEGGLVILPPSGGRTWRTGSLPTDLDLPSVPERLRPAARVRKPRDESARAESSAPEWIKAEHMGKGVVDPVDPAELRAALFAVSPDDYDNWFTCLAALKNDLGEAGRALALEWTEAGKREDLQSRRIDRFDAKWDKDLETNNSGTEIHIGSIFHLANEAAPGWRSPTGRHGRPKWRRQ